MATAPPRKKPRLLAKGTAKIGNLFSRRRQNRNQPLKNTSESDSEDDEPILSQVDAAQTDQSSKPNVGLRIAVPSGQYGDSTSETQDSASGIRDQAMVREEQDASMNPAGARSLKAQRRMGMVAMQYGLITFQSHTTSSHARAVLRDTVSADNHHEFSFSAPFNATPEMRQAGARSAHARGDEKHIGIQGGQVSFSSTRANPLSAVFLPKPSNCISSPEKPTGARSDPKTSRPGPLDHLKLTPSQPPTPRLDKATAITDIKDYLSPRIPCPGVPDKLYRNASFRPELSSKIFNSTIPDCTELSYFVSDVEGDTTLTLTKNGDAPALSKPERVRVPVGARLGKLNSDKNREEDGDTIMTNTSPIALPPHVQTKPRKRKKRAPPVKDSPDDAYTSSQRLLNAYETVKQARKRKKKSNPGSLPPAVYIFQRTGRTDFIVFRHGFLMLPELCLLLAANLPVQTLINLYSISKDFHIIINQRFTTVILNQVSLKAPNAARCYPWRCFKHLCQPDPALAAQTTSLAEHISSADVSHGNTGGAQVNIKPAPAPPSASCLSRNPYLQPHTRRVPTFRWLHLAIHREKVIHALYHAFAARGVPLPGNPTDTETDSFCHSLHKLWFMFDIPDNPRRIQYAQTVSLLSDNDLAHILTFVVKLDMICNEPIAPEKKDGVRKMLMASCDGFDTILKVIRREVWRDELGVFRAWTRYGFQLDREDNRRPHPIGGWQPLGLSAAEHEASKTVFGIPKEQVGMLKREFWGELEYDREKRRRKTLPVGVRRRLPEYGRRPAYLIRPEQLTLREVVRRGYTFEKSFLDAVLIGYIDYETGEGLPPRDLNGGRSRVLENEGEYDVDDAVAGLRALSVEDGGDPLLDLGSTYQGNPSLVMHQGPTKSEVKRREEEQDTLEGYMAAWKQEVEAEKIQRAQMAYCVID